MTAGSLLSIRPAGPADAAAIAALHVAVWRLTYAGLAPPAAVARLDLAHRLPQWRAALAPGARGATLLALRDARLAGFVRFGPASQPELGEAGEIKHLYVDPACARQGIGRQLLSAAFDGLRRAGCAEAALAVVRGNDPALAFYRAAGGRPAGHFTDAGPLWRSENLILRWVL
ncbi:GNAT family N-acetyltransferase [Pseudodonghicola flavimaris]|uniref:N-acetyltransferase n=1 Tax=Pseudodonghicola flavimaris TaxID=3050036 RepID=A0ABT7EYU3_9RHOB|nr:N-acetyltransferase [Pseudodonghicola flavimaris]MDK3017518.1 N-acetyltransferase [Pseudodonghicola flavimaris]